MNVHHLELFYFVARHKGVSAAARHMPYGIQQPAISSQILQLEDSLGVTLYHRRPFSLTREGEDLFRFIAPFFSGMDEMGRRLRGGVEKRLRIAAPEIVQRDYLPALLARMRKRVPGFHFTVQSGRVDEIESRLVEQQIDIGLSTFSGRASAGVQRRTLVRMPLVLLLPKAAKVSSAADILSADRIPHPLITLHPSEPVCRVFQDELRKRGVDWFPTLEVSSLDIISRYVAAGFGIGLSTAVRSLVTEGLKALPLEGFPELEFGAAWTGRLSPLGEAFLEEAERAVKDLRLM